MEKDKKGRLRNFSRKLGLASMAIIWCLAERGTALLEEALTGKGHGLRKSLRRIDQLKTIEDCYEILKNLDKNTARTIIWRLEKKGLVQKSKNSLKLTKIGSSLYETIQNVKKLKESWDGRFRIAMFDVPENKRRYRDSLRVGLLRQGYVPIQKSVFIGKRPLDKDFVEQLIEKNLYHYLRLIIVEDIDDESILENLS